MSTTEKARVSCPLCSATFSRGSGLTRHITRKHSAEEAEAATQREDEIQEIAASFDDVVDAGIVELPQPADSVDVGAWLLLLDGVERQVTRKMSLAPGTTVTLYFGPNYWVTMPARTPVRRITK